MGSIRELQNPSSVFNIIVRSKFNMKNICRKLFKPEVVLSIFLRYSWQENNSET